MRVNMRLVTLEKTLSASCMMLCLLALLFSKIALSAGADSGSVFVNPSESIQAYINNATTGETIFVNPGTYNESLQINKSISLIGAGIDRTVVYGQDPYVIINITASDVDIQGFTISSALYVPAYGINIFNSRGDVISHNLVENAQQGIGLTSSSNNTISDNVITANTQYGINIAFSNNNRFSGNTISGNDGGFGIYLSASTSNVVSGNTFADNYLGEDVSYSSLNSLYWNNFFDAVQVEEVGSDYPNSWDNGAEGNYWSNYVGIDRGDGIGNQSYTVAQANLDNYPLMGRFYSFDATLASQAYQVSIISNSTVSDFAFELGTETANKVIRFNVTNPEGVTGFSRITIPSGLINISTLPMVLVGDTEIVPTFNTSLNYVYFTYSDTSQMILIISSKTLDLYNQLLAEFLTLNATYYQLLNNYTAQLISNYTAQINLLANYTAQLQSMLNTLNSTYTGILSSYSSLLGNFTQLQQKYSDLNTSNDQNTQNVRSLMYIFAAAAAILIIITVYFSRRAHTSPQNPPEEQDRFQANP